jgi:hypothetical protein
MGEVVPGGEMLLHHWGRSLFSVLVTGVRSAALGMANGIVSKRVEQVADEV